MKKYNSRAESANSLLSVGLDADIGKIPEEFREEEFPQFAFNKFIIDQTAEYAAAFKPNAAFYETRGDQGLRELKMTVDYLAEHYPDIFTIYDAKRGDHGNTNKAYAEAIFDWLGFDAVTLHPYLGKEALQPFLDRKDKVSIILCRTSNEGAGEFQDLKTDPIGNSSSSNGAGGKPLWQVVAEKVSNEWNQNENCMLVVGATYPEEMKIVRSVVGDMTLLVPGIGAQGGDVMKVVTAGLNSAGKGLIINSSRGIIFSENPESEAKKLRDEINAHRG